MDEHITEQQMRWLLDNGLLQPKPKKGGAVLKKGSDGWTLTVPIEYHILRRPWMDELASIAILGDEKNG